MAIRTEAQAVEMPPGVTLAPDERVLAGGSFMFSNLLFFLHWRMAVTSKRLVGQTPNTILGIIPLGSTQVSYPLAAIAGVKTRTAYSVLALALGAILLLAGIANGNAILLILGVLGLAAAFNAKIEVTNSGGGTTGHQVAFLDRGSANAFLQQVSTVIATHAHQSPTVVIGAAAAPAAPAVSLAASDALAELGRLRDAGHLSAEEYEAKRREIIGRL